MRICVTHSYTLIKYLNCTFRFISYSFRPFCFQNCSTMIFAIYSSSELLMPFYYLLFDCVLFNRLFVVFCAFLYFSWYKFKKAHISAIQNSWLNFIKENQMSARLVSANRNRHKLRKNDWFAAHATEEKTSHKFKITHIPIKVTVNGKWIGFKVRF